MRKHTELTVPLKKSRLTGVQRLSNKEQICDVREARFAASVRLCKEGGQKVAVTFIPPFRS
jgi:hypothetical protein